MNNIIKRTWNKNAMVNIEDLRGMAFQAESGGHTFQISGIDGDGNPVALSGTPAGILLRSDNQDVTLTCSISDGKVNATLPANAYSVPGRLGITIFLTSDGQKTAIYAAVCTVGKTSSGTVAPPAGSDVVTLVNQINAAINAIPVNYNAAFAVAYENLTFPVTAGTYCIYNGALKKAIVDIATSETYTAAHWTNANFGQDLNSLKSAYIDEIGTYDISYAFTKTYRINTNVGIGNTVDLTPVSSVSWQYVIIPVVSGEVYIINAKGGSAGRAYAVVDANNKLLVVAGDGVTVENLAMTIPSGGTKLIVNSNTTYSSTSVVKKQIIDKEYIDKKTANYEKVINAISKDQLESGGWSNNEKYADTKRIRYGTRIKVEANTVFKLVNSNLYYLVAIFETEESTTAIDGSNWTQEPFTCTHAGYVNIIFANAATYGTSTTITVDDFGNSIFVVSQIDMPQKVYDVSFGMHMIIGSNKIPEFSYNNHVLSVVIPANVSLTYCGGKTGNGYTVFTPADILEQLGSSKFVYDANSMTFLIGSDYGVLYFDTQTMTFGINNGSTRIYDNWLVLALNWYGNIFGDWVYKAAYEKTIENDTKISLLDAKANLKDEGTPYYTKMQNYCKLIYGDSVASGFTAPEIFENFIWFTDPHTMYGDYTELVGNRTFGCKYFDKYIDELRFAYESTPTDFVLCGGDWNDAGTPDEELFKLSRAVERCKKELSPFYNCVGNHDTNYMGKKDSESAAYTSRFSTQCLKDLWYRDQDHCYYTFNGKNTKFYVFDTQVDDQYLYSDDFYLGYQLKWFCHALESDNSEHIALAMHIYYYTGTTVARFAKKIMDAACAYNARTTFTYERDEGDRTTYDFTNATGKIEFALAGHSHADYETRHEASDTSIPVIASINAGNATGSGSSYYGAPHCVFDLIHVNYDEGVRQVNLIRIGAQGTDRIVNLDESN